MEQVCRCQRQNCYFACVRTCVCVGASNNDIHFQKVIQNDCCFSFSFFLLSATQMVDIVSIICITFALSENRNRFTWQRIMDNKTQYDACRLKYQVCGNNKTGNCCANADREGKTNKINGTVDRTECRFGRSGITLLTWARRWTVTHCLLLYGVCASRNALEIPKRASWPSRQRSLCG